MNIDQFERAGLKASPYARGGVINSYVALHTSTQLMKKFAKQNKVAIMASYRYNVAASTGTHTFKFSSFVA